MPNGPIPLNHALLANRGNRWKRNPPLSKYGAPACAWMVRARTRPPGAGRVLGHVELADHAEVGIELGCRDPTERDAMSAGEVEPDPGGMAGVEPSQ
jgi:hypothetical protein